MNKKKNKKLILSAETLRNLSAPDLQEVLGQVSRVCTADCANTATHICSTCNPCN